jgi:hypothetical protein
MLGWMRLGAEERRLRKKLFTNICPLRAEDLVCHENFTGV